MDRRLKFTVIHFLVTISVFVVSWILIFELGFGGAENKLAGIVLAISTGISMILSFPLLQVLELDFIKLLPDSGWIVAIALFLNSMVQVYSIAALYKKYKLGFEVGRESGA